MIATEGSPQRARWAVMCISSKGGRPHVVRKDFGDDYASAMEMYLKARDKGLRGATLACINMGFPPPGRLRPHTVTKRGRDKRTRKIRTVKVTVKPLRELNLQGKLWCPYCMTLRRFVLKKTFRIQGVKVHQPRWVCPICNVSHRDYHVRVWNPTATMHMDSSLATVTRSPRKTPPKRRRRR